MNNWSLGITNLNKSDIQFFMYRGSQYQPFEYWKHLITKLFEVRNSNSSLFKVGSWALSFVLDRLPDQYIRKQDGVHFSTIQMVRLYGTQPLLNFPAAEWSWFGMPFEIWRKKSGFPMARLCSCHLCSPYGLCYGFDHSNIGPFELN